MEITMKNKITSILAIFAFSTSMAFASDDDMKTYRVTITNATTSHIITPPLLATHQSDYSVFKVGGISSEGLATQAETGSPAAIGAEVSSSANVHAVVLGDAPIFGGESISYKIQAPKKARLSFTAMLATTNDGFAGLDSVSLPKNSATYFAYVYDAGSEMNNEDCDFIPGPPCNNGVNNRTDANEGFISIHNGVHGVADLIPANLDWRGAAVVVTVERIRD